MLTRTRQLRCNDIDCPHEKLKKFNDWTRDKLPNSYTGYRAYDLDWVFWQRGTSHNIEKIMMVEVKTFCSSVKPDQLKTYLFLDQCIKQYVSNFTETKYYGFHVLVFERTFFDDGKCWLNNKEISENDLITFLSFQDLPRIN